MAKDCSLFLRKSWVALSILLASVYFFRKAPLAQTKTQRVAILKSANIAPYNQAIEAFKSNLPNKQAHVYEYNLEGDLENGPHIVQTILNSNIDLVLAVGLKATLVAKLEISDIPVIFCMVLNPKKFNLEAPNLTGISLAIPFKEQVLLLQSIIPTLSRIGVLYDPDKSGHLVKEGKDQAQELGITLTGQEVSSQKDFPTALRQLLPGIHAICLFPDSTVLTEDLSISSSRRLWKNNFRSWGSPPV